MKLYFKHIALTAILFGVATILYMLIFGFSLAYNGNIMATSLHNEGPHITWCNNDTLQIDFIQQVDKNQHIVKSIKSHSDELKEVNCYYPLDSTQFNVPIQNEVIEDSISFKTQSKILVISDMEGNFNTLRKLLTKNHVIDSNLNWTFGSGHLVLLGDFVDRGSFVTQILWLIYKLEFQAREKGGYVHYILGNHELKNLYGDYYSASQKYLQTAGILGRQQFELYNHQSFLGRWLASKNVLVRINDNLFVHGGIHPDIIKYNFSIEDINTIVKNSYRKYPYQSIEHDSVKLIKSDQTGVCWYRGYFDSDFKEESLDLILNKFKVSHIVVGHTIQEEVNTLFNGKLFAIDVLHPQDQYNYFPTRNSQGLLIDGGKCYKIDDSGKNHLLLK
ncbi:MAG: metallophosphoesterase [Chryseotalea sp.]|jgi:hypothetical protein